MSKQGCSALSVGDSLPTLMRQTISNSTHIVYRKVIIMTIKWINFYNKAFSTYLRKNHGKRMNTGICDYVSQMVLDHVSKVTHLTDALGPYSPSVSTQWECIITPPGWHRINHYYMVFECTDGMCIIDCPMAQYARHDNVNWYFVYNNNIKIGIARSLKDVMNMWGCSREEAMSVVKDVRLAKEDGAAYRTKLTIKQLVEALKG